ncbi:MAG: GNAT family N-acetyltransferase [Chloroflexi bacterium]|nr:GNAT family N-acetyltransferase [Chloroflexota bacterium]
MIGRVLTHPWLVFNPLFRERLTLGLTILRRLRRTQPAPPVAWSELAKPSFGILAIATHPACQGQGVGKRLMVAAESWAREKGFDKCTLPFTLITNRPYSSMKDWVGIKRKNLAVGVGG